MVYLVRSHQTGQSEYRRIALVTMCYTVTLMLQVFYHNKEIDSTYLLSKLMSCCEYSETSLCLYNLVNALIMVGILWSWEGV